VATAFIAVTVSGRNEATQIRKIAVRSPTPNHRMAIGIHASGEIGRRIWIHGLSASSARRYQPIDRPSGTPSGAAATKPHVTRYSEATTYFSSSP
jgi:hypothetical protein